ncbi:MAG: hypothetical protein K6G16_01975 [Lachnospiraceae bacterium]|nr:hypothetical protein [Lachnospiraceae bacterium]
MPERDRRKHADGGGTEERSAADYYELKTQAVDDLVNADASNTPHYSQEELDRYRSRRERHIADWVKILFVKFWFAGAVCFFFFWGLGSYLGTLIDQLFVIGMAMGIVTDLFTNNVIRFFAKTPEAGEAWMMVPRKRYVSFFLNILYAYVILFFVYTLYQFINVTAAAVSGRPDRVALGVEPLLFGLFYLGFDLLLLACRRLFRRIVQDARANLAKGTDAERIAGRNR